MMRRQLLQLLAAAPLTRRGDGLRRPVNAPQAGNVSLGVQPGSGPVTLTRFVIVSGAGGGVFIYNGVPGRGNPPTEWITEATTDPYGNALPTTGVGSESAAGWASLTHGIVNVSNALNATSGQLLADAAGGTTDVLSPGLPADVLVGVLKLFSPVAAGQAIPELTWNGNIVSTAGTAASPTLVATDTWHALAPANGWANVAGNVPLEYRLMTDKSVWVMGTLSGAANTSGTIGTLPAGYRPATQQAFIIGTNAGGVATSDRVLQVTTGGVMTILDTAATPMTGTAFINGRFSLDA